MMRIQRDMPSCQDGLQSMSIVTAQSDIRSKRKHIVLPSWVEECVDEETLMNEDGEPDDV